MIPKFSDMFKPFLEYIQDGNLHKISNIINYLQEFYNISTEEREQLAPSGSGRLFDNRVRWCRLELKMDNMIEAPERGLVKITEKGKEILNNGKELKVSYLRNLNKTEVGTEVSEHPDSGQSPIEQIENMVKEHNKGIEELILEKLLNLDPYEFEKILLDILGKMGYGTDYSQSKIHTGKSGDHGIDGIINQDRLGIDKIFIQAKRWKKEETVGEPEIHKFYGALERQRSNKGLFITTSKFSPNAIDFASQTSKTIILIDGKQLANYMVEYGIGVRPLKEFILYDLDEDFFD